MKIQHVFPAGSLSLCLLCGWLAIPALAQQRVKPSIIPWPQSITLTNGTMDIFRTTRLVVKNPKLMPLAEIFADEVSAVIGLRPPVVSDASKAGDFVLALDPARKAGGYDLVVTDRAEVSAGDYQGAVAGTATILQALVVNEDGTIFLPCMTVRDFPHADFCGVILDVARRDFSIEQIRDCVTLCRLYKVRYLQLHLTDNEGWTLPVAKYPLLGTKNIPGRDGGRPARRYGLRELKGLVAYADARGVTLVPEIEMPGHCGAAERCMPEVFGARDPETKQFTGLGVMNLSNQELYPVLDAILSETAGIFTSSPYIHIGGDELDFTAWEKLPEATAYKKITGLNTAALFRQFIMRMNTTVKKLGKRTIVWEGFDKGDKVNVPANVIVMNLRNWYYRADDLVRDGYTVINCPWSLGCAWDDWNIYMCNGIQLKPSDPVLGATWALWNVGGDSAVNTLRGVARRNERTWNVDTSRKSDDFNWRFVDTDKVADKLLCRLTWQARGTVSRGGSIFNDTARLELTPCVKGYVVRYTTDGREPTASSPAYSAPLELKDTTPVAARVFDSAGKSPWLTWRKTFECRPFSVIPIGAFDGRRFTSNVTLSVETHVPGGTVRYTQEHPSPGGAAPAIADEPRTGSLVFDKPIVLEQSLKIRARYFDAAGKPLGYTFTNTYQKVNYEKNLATWKPVGSSGEVNEEFSTLAVDGLVECSVNPATYWGAGPAPQWLMVDLEEEKDIADVQLYTFWGDKRYYQYTIAVSTDSASWITVVDASANTVPADENGYKHVLAPVKARYVKVTMLKNSAGPAVHIVELRVHGPASGGNK
ncbi:MAG: family 20 glycosylhydrolase [bacterium]